jgi:hypothetical protein
MLNRPAPVADAPINLLVNGDWQMSFGERAAIEQLGFEARRARPGR